MAQFCTGHQTMSSPGQNGEPSATKAQVKLLDTHPRDGPGDHQLLDLFGAFEDVVGPTEESSGCRWVRLSVVFPAFRSSRERPVLSRALRF